MDFVNITGASAVTNTAITTTPASTAPSAAVSEVSLAPANHLPAVKIVRGVLGGIFAAVATITVGVILLKTKKKHKRQRVNGFPLARK